MGNLRALSRRCDHFPMGLLQRSALVASCCVWGLACGDNNIHPGGLDDASGDGSDADDRVAVESGLGSPDQLTFADAGAADPSAPMRALMAFPIRDEVGLDATLAQLYDASSPSFRAYLTADGWRAAHAPLRADVDKITAWLLAQGFTVPRVSSNSLLLEFDGTVGQFNAAFGISLRVLHKIVGADSYQYGTLDTLRMPTSVAPLIASVLTCDQPAADSVLPGEAGNVTSTPPPNVDMAYSPARIAHAYGADTIAASGHRGAGTAIGIITAGTFKFKDLQSFWLGFGITRADPEVVVAMPPIATRSTTATVALEWSGALAPAARLVAYEGSDVRDTSLVYTFNEAIAQAGVNVLIYTHAHSETWEPVEIRWQYHRSAKMAAALGMSVVASSGDSLSTAVPSDSSWVIAVGGTTLTDDGGGNILSETAWNLTGKGESLTIPMPAWQSGLVPAHSRRGANELALNAGNPYWIYAFSTWKTLTGTALGASSFGAILALVDDQRAARGAAPVGCLNPQLYGTIALQQSFRDITGGLFAGVGWDRPSGWGAPRADQIDAVIP